MREADGRPKAGMRRQGNGRQETADGRPEAARGHGGSPGRMGDAMAKRLPRPAGTQ